MRAYPLFPPLQAMLMLLATVAGTTAVAAQDRTVIDLTGPGWRLWLDRDAGWRDDPLFFPTPALDQLPVNPPSGGWSALTATQGIDVSVPGTVEQYLQQTAGPDGDLVGVSWWWRTVTLPKSDAPRRVLLRFESARQRIEIFINRRLAGYDVVGNSPVEFDVSRFVTPGADCEIAVRVTDPGGNFDWRDSQPMRWGRYLLPISHGFGGITGGVQIVVCDPVYVHDVHVQNTPAITEAHAIVTVRNTTGAAVTRDLDIRVSERAAPGRQACRESLRRVALPAGETQLAVKISAPDTQVWDLDHPTLYVCEATLHDGAVVADSDRRTFGFRWFAPEQIGSDAIFRLNGRRIVLRTSISWGFWPVNGIFPTAELAARQVRVAKELGLNMLNFHRAIGNPVVLDQADEQGLLYFEEPGAHKCVDRESNVFGRQLAREKWLRMVRRDRSHPSLAIYNLINEWDSRNSNPDPEEIARHREDMRAAHDLDPSRVILHTSAWARGEDIDDPAKLHFRPFDSDPHLHGWYDVHHAGGPATWNEGLYRGPADFYGRTNNRREIVFWGEEGAISTPPRLALIKASLASAPNLGWDGAMYLEWHDAFDAFLDRKGLRGAFPTVDAWTTAMGAVSFRHQGRRIENMRMSDVGDGYAINGWEAEIIENHSGIVDCFRHPKADPSILAYYNQPLYVAVKARNTIVQPPAGVVADFFAVNEKDLRGPHRLAISLRDEAGREVAHREIDATLAGGETYGQLLATAVVLPVGAAARGMLRIDARLLDAGGAERASGHDEVWAVDWKGDELRGTGAVWESDERVRRFLGRMKGGAGVPAFDRMLPKLDWIVVTRGPSAAEPTPIPESCFSLPPADPAAAVPNRPSSGPAATHGLQVTFFEDLQLRRPVHQRVDPRVAYVVEDGAAPDANLAMLADYGVRWEAQLRAQRTGDHVFVVRSTGGVRLSVDGQPVIDSPPPRNAQASRATVALRADTPVRLTLELRQGHGTAQCKLSWITPDEDPAIAPAILERLRRDGTTLILLDRADAWMPLVTGPANPGVTCSGTFRVGKAWLGGIHFVREHPLFAGLPVNTAMDWPYQAVVRNGDERVGLRLEGEELAAGCYHCYPMELGTVVGVIPLGRGRIVFSTLDISAQLGAPPGPADVARKLLGNFINYRP